MSLLTPPQEASRLRARERRIAQLRAHERRIAQLKARTAPCCACGVELPYGKLFCTAECRLALAEFANALREVLGLAPLWQDGRDARETRSAE